MDPQPQCPGQSGQRDSSWRSLGAPPQELQLDFCLPTGQSFRWRQTGSATYTGVIGSRLVVLRQTPTDVEYRVLARGSGAAPRAEPGADADAEADAAALRDYFNLDTRLADLAPAWADRCERFRAVSPHFPGARMLRQDPLECLFQFICSSNNHISRIHGMVERLCSAYGTPLAPTAAAAGPAQGEPADAADGGAAGGGLAFYAFPSLEQLSGASEEELRAAGFGYRARFIVGTTRALLAKPGGGRAWLLGLRGVGLQEALGALEELPGIGPKVAACICLFSLDKHAAIPVDTHVWQLALRHYAPHLRGRSLTKGVHAEVQRAFVDRFGPYAGWAHNTLFISELASQQHRLPEGVRLTKAAATGRRQKGAATVDADSDTDVEDGNESSGSEAAVATRTSADRQSRNKGRKAAERSSGSQPSGMAASPAAKRGWRGRGVDGEAAGDAAVREGTHSPVREGETVISTPPQRKARRRGPGPEAPRKRAAGKRQGVAAAEYDVADFDDLAS